MAIVTAGAVTQQIRQLEATLGFAVFRRLPQGVALTDAAREALPRLTRGFDMLGQAVQALREAQPNRPLAEMGSRRDVQATVVEGGVGERDPHRHIVGRLEPAVAVVLVQRDVARAARVAWQLGDELVVRERERRTEQCLDGVDVPTVAAEAPDRGGPVLHLFRHDEST